MFILIVLTILTLNSYYQEKRIEELENSIINLRKETNNAIKKLIEMSQRIKKEIKNEKND